VSKHLKSQLFVCKKVSKYVNFDFNIFKLLVKGLKLKKKKKFLEVATIMTGIKQTNSGRQKVV